MNVKRVLMLSMIPVFVAGSMVVGFAEEKQKKEKLVANEANIKYIPFPSEFKKYEVSPWKMLKFQEFNKAYKKILGAKAKEKWLEKLDGPSTPNEMIDVDHSKFVIIHSCKQHYCNTHLVLILFNPVTSRTRGFLLENAKIIWLGNPDVRIKSLLKGIAKIIWPDLKI